MSSPRAPLRIMTCEPAHGLASRVARELDTPLVEINETWFSCGEGKLGIAENVRGTDLYVFQSIIDPSDERSTYDRFVMMLHAVEAARLADAQYVTAVVPYFPGARQDKRKHRTREGISAGLFARCMQEAGARRVISVEIHNEAIGGMFDPPVCMLENLYLHDVLCPWLKAHRLDGGVVASPDVGGLERARSYAERLSTPLAALSKVRDYAQPNRIVQSTLIGDVAGQDVLLVDDIIDTAGSVVAAVAELKAGGARNVTVACAHPVLSGPAWERLSGLADQAEAEGWRFRVVGTSSVEHAAPPTWYRSFDIAPLLARVIKSVNRRGSVTGAQRNRGW